MKIISWNVNGIRSCIAKGFYEFVLHENPDIICLQEIKADADAIDLHIDGYYSYWNPAQKRGYAGTLVLSKLPALYWSCGIDGYYMDEGRLITISYNGFYLVNCYSPHARRDLNNLNKKHLFTLSLIDYIRKLNKSAPVILCGDLNVAHEDIDLKNSKANIGNAGFTDVERDDFTQLLSAGMIDIYRELNPNELGSYTWWSYMKDVRSRNIGWRIDYFLASEELAEKVITSTILNNVYGSDHCPISLTIHL